MTKNNNSTQLNPGKPKKAPIIMNKPRIFFPDFLIPNNYLPHFIYYYKSNSTVMEQNLKKYLIGKGSFGNVYKFTYEGKDYAIKKIKIDKSHDYQLCINEI